MNYYKRHIGDYAAKAGHLSPLEHGVYGLLIDAYYNREEAPTKAEAIRWARARSADELAAVDAVLAEFFAEVNGRFVQNRIEEELSAFRIKQEANRALGQRGGQAKAKRLASETLSGTVSEPLSEQVAGRLANGGPSHKPLATSHETTAVPTEPADKPADPIWGTGLAFLQRKGLETKQARAFLGKLRQKAGDVSLAALLADAEAQDISDPIPWLSAGAVAAHKRGMKPSASDDFRGKTYDATSDDDLPDGLR